jgi:histidine ammonia-lyase
MVIDAERVVALELMVAAQALDYRRDMLNAARALAAKSDLVTLASKVENRPEPDASTRAAFEAEVTALAAALASAGDFHPGPTVAAAHAEIRRHVGFIERDRALDGDVKAIIELVASGALLRLLPAPLR